MSKLTKKRLAKALKPFFEMKGFEERTDARGTYFCRDHNPGEVDYIDIELSTELDFILQRVFDQGCSKQISLSDFRGISFYEIELEYNVLMDQIIEDFNCYGIPWILGEDVTTDYLESSKVRAQEYLFNDILEEARKAFKSQDYETACKLYEKASKIKGLEGSHLAAFKFVSGE